MLTITRAGAGQPWYVQPTATTPTLHRLRHGVRLPGLSPAPWPRRSTATRSTSPVRPHREPHRGQVADLYRRQHAHGERRRCDRVFTITAGADVTMDGLIVGNGWLSNTLYTKAGAGAGIFNTGT